ncbi:AMP-binding protein [Saccharothrix syringae]|uniref:Cyclohexanecarboxylate-CoA ligase n=1 Tax=Saccharothrix syringae TaxID=103733 RepID=A0A5Q0GYJ1_SACSY|nr:AMP-binding protein [Saccharothrix syringae]QFZ19061.1 cyclohexanecarboxylate-CoA ligase [Saccharothrix syringae]
MSDQPIEMHDPEEYLAQGWWRAEETLVDDLRRAAREHPQRRAVVVWHTDGRTKETLTYAELERKVERIAAGLAGLGVARGDVVTLQLPNSWQLLATSLACFRIGAVAGPVLPIMRKRELTFMTGLTESNVYIGPVRHRGFSHAELSEEVAREVPTLRHRVLVGLADEPAGTPGLDGALDFDTALLGEPGTEGALVGDTEGREAHPDDLAYVMFTSGTTGEPKGVMHSHNTLHATNRMQVDALHLTGDEVTAMGSPTTHNAGWTWNFTMPLLMGATCVHIDNWDADLMLRVLEEEKVTFFMGAPPFLVDLIDRQRDQARDLSHLKTFATGSAPIPPVLVEQARDVLGCRLYALWGMTENGAPTITRPEDPEMRAAESDGSAVPGMEVRIVGDDLRPVPAGETGRLQVRGATQCLGYFRRPDVYADNVTDDGWFDTGDLARDDGHGGIRIAGREKDVISRGGEKVPVVEVEAALLRHPGIKDVAVVGYPDDRLGERACAVIVPQDEPPQLPDLREHLDSLGMAKQYWPERVEHTAELPKTPSGKVQKFRLREQLVDS